MYRGYFSKNKDLISHKVLAEDFAEIAHKSDSKPQTAQKF